MRVIQAVIDSISRGFGFFKKQERDWKITVVRTNSTMFFYRMVFPYLSVYIIALGATGTQLGIVNSVGMVVAGLAGPLSGWLIDRGSIKKIYLVGIVMLAGSYLIYGVAQSWPVIIIAMIVYWVGTNTSIHGCAVICANCLRSEERATGMAICETFGMGLLGLGAPMVGAWIVSVSGGVNVSGIRPLFFICLAGTIATFFLILTQLSNRRWGSVEESRSNFFGDMSQVFKQGHHLKRWIIIASVTGMPMGMVTPFIQPFAHEFKGADQYVLGAMITAAAVVPLLLGIPFGRLSDKIGRKKVLYLLAPLVWLSYLMLIFAPNPSFLIVSGALAGFFMLTGITSEAMSRELVPPEQMGRWTGMIRFFRMLFNAFIVYIAGVIWDHIGPEYVFLTIIVLDLFVRIPLLLGMPETLASQTGSEQPG